MQVVIVTGMSGAGKSCIMDVMEDIGYYCVDNLPPALITSVYDICLKTGTDDKIAIAVDLRSGDMFSEIYACLNELREKRNVEVKLLYVEASDEVLVRRYKETRRKHPLLNKFDGSLRKCIIYERKQLRNIKENADYYIETTHISSNQLKEQIRDLFLENKFDSMSIKVISFGFKFGASTETDLLYDVRCLPNPYYISDLKNLTGLDRDVRDYVMQFSQSKKILEMIEDYLDFTIPLYAREGKSQLVIAFGCTGGKHRSVTFAELVYKYLKDKGYRVQKQHRDIDKR